MDQASPSPLTLLHSEWPKLHRVLAILSATGLKVKGYTSKADQFYQEIFVPLPEGGKVATQRFGFSH